MKIGFALIPHIRELKSIILIENKIHNDANFNSLLQVDTNIPHLTIFQGEFDNSYNYVSTAEKLFTYIIKNFSNNNLYFKEIIYVQNGWYFLSCDKTLELQALHDFTLELCKKDVKKGIPKDKDKILTPTQYENIKKYGYRYSGKEYSPHITIGRNNYDKNPRLLSLLIKEFSNFPKITTFEKLTVYKMGLDGTHEQTLFEKNFENF